MAIKIKNNFVEENIEDESGNILGKIRFNPNDARIMNKLSKIVKDLSESLKEVKNLGEMPNITKEELTTLEDFEKVSKDFERVNAGYEIEAKAIDEVIKDLTEIFGEETINIFTGGTKDVTSLLPLIDYIMPYVKDAREGKVNKYLVNQKDPEILE